MPTKPLSIALLLLFGSTPLMAQVYKCEIDGQTLYQAQPCESGQQDIKGVISEVPSQMPTAIEDNETIKPAKKNKAESIPPKPYSSCGAITFLSMQAFTTTALNRRLGGGVYLPRDGYQCAHTRLKLPGFHGRLWNDDLSIEIAKRISATLVTGSQIRAGLPYGFKQQTFDSRVNRNTELSFDVCFGFVDFSVAQISCH